MLSRDTPALVFQLTLTIDCNAAERITERLELAGATAVSLADASDTPIYEPGVGETPLWAQTQLLAWFDDLTEARSGLADIEALLDSANQSDVSIEPVAEQDWELAGHQESPLLSFGGRLWVTPPQHAHNYRNQPHIVMTAGLAFGTGTHPSTALCLDWLAGQDLEGKTVVDYGCGSGILGIAALKLGASRVTAIDHDEQALTATCSNARRNHVDTRLTAITPDDYRHLAVDLVIANILLNPLLALAPRFAEMVNPRARVVLSGVMKDQVQILCDEYTTWFELETVRFRDDWACVGLAYRSAPARDRFP